MAKDKADGRHTRKVSQKHSPFSIRSAFSRLGMENTDQLPDAPYEEISVRRQIEDTFASVSGVIKASLRPEPTETGDGSYINPPDSTNALQDLQKLGFSDVDNLVSAFRTSVSGESIDDKTYLMENIIKIASELPPNSENGKDLTNGFLDQLWNDLAHPPQCYLGDKYKYRQADGSYNNIREPSLGAANTPYARSVQPRTLQPADLPDPGVIFDCVLARKEFEPHPNKLSSMLFYLASIIIHDLFRTDHDNFANSQTSSYLDLSPLYGSNQHEQDAMRTFKDGKIKADCFSEKRLLGFPPGVGVILIMFNRFHNYVVQQLALINEGGRFTKPKQGNSLVKYDNDLFQTGRLITCGLYVNCILKDYVRTILDLNRTDSVWALDPRAKETSNIFGPATAQGTGNQVSAEFNMVYRWHAAVSDRDDKWTQQQFEELFPGKHYSEVGAHELVIGLDKWERSLPNNPQDRPFADVKRGADGQLDDEKLVKILTESVEDLAGSFGANRIPQVLRSIEILGTIQARSWNLATLNEFRDFFHLKKHETFEEINPDPIVAEQLKRLYLHPDWVELYPGLVVESAKKPMAPGSGLCASFTAARAILSDAVALVRGDRFYTFDYTPQNLTPWGFNESNYDVNVDQGHVFYKLILRAFPNYFQTHSVFAHFPFVIPSENRKILRQLETDFKYTWDRPFFNPSPTFITSYEAGKSILSNKEDFKVTWGKAITFLMHREGKQYGADFMLSGDREVNAQSRKVMSKALYRDNWENETKRFYETITLELLHRHSYKLAGVSQVDIVRDVGNLAQTHFAAEVFSLPLKTQSNPRGVYAEQELYTAMALVFTDIFFNADPAKSFPLEEAARKLVQQLGELVMANVLPISASGFLAGVIERFHQHTLLTNYGMHMIQHLLDSGLSVKDLVWSQILPTAGGMVANQAQLFAQTLDYYLSDEGSKHLKEINRLAKMDTPEADDLILRYFMEGSRMSCVVGLYRDVATEHVVNDGGEIKTLKPGDRIFIDCITASKDPTGFPNPNEVVLDRPMDSYIHYGWGPHICLGYGLSKTAMMTMLKTIGRLDNLRRTPGPQGQIKKINGPEGVTLYMTPDHSSFFPFPTTMKIQWDGDLPALPVGRPRRVWGLDV